MVDGCGDGGGGRALRSGRTTAQCFVVGLYSSEPKFSLYSSRELYRHLRYLHSSTTDRFRPRHMLSGAPCQGGYCSPLVDFTRAPEAPMSARHSGIRAAVLTAAAVLVFVPGAYGGGALNGGDPGAMPGGLAANLPPPRHPHNQTAFTIEFDVDGSRARHGPGNAPSGRPTFATIQGCVDAVRRARMAGSPGSSSSTPRGAARCNLIGTECVSHRQLYHLVYRVCLESLWADLHCPARPLSSTACG